MKTRAIIIEIICCLFIAMFLYAAITKLTDYHNSFLKMLNQPFDNKYAPFMTWAVPAVEIIISSLLISEKTRRIGLYAATGLMLIFSGYVTFVLSGYYNGVVPCSCGGFLSSMNWTQHLLFNLFFVAIGVVALFFHKRKNAHRETRTSNVYA
ncbi:MauE/DoxX family redox-associated membrane protein [uncultured Chitinophaga sp.]|uniref:MauE/DoxX family redox-associated membrane protein n=1 Tax=uncultured Chitinophaga sp. TaxID=339340 RepID=UPI0025E18A3E|nr:MauE/DoxX family redox-associated membrane protein [uncultured Chitinophaga sp.]